MRRACRPWLLPGSPAALGRRLLACHVAIVPGFWRRSIAGAAGAWGLREFLPGRLHAEPSVLPGRLLPAVIELLNELMTGTPAGTLSDVSLKD